MPPSTFTFTDLKSTVAASKGQAKLAATGQGEKKGKGNKGEWLKQNKEVNRRAARDVELREAALDRHSCESIKAKMEKKSEQYNQLKRGLTGGLTEAQLAEQAVDWGAKAEHRFSSEGEDSEDEGHADAEASEPEDEPTVEYVDDFGRSHFAPRSKVPLQYRRNIQTDEPVEDDGGIVINDARHHFPVYEPTVEQLAKVEESLQEEEIEMHYDASRNVRDHGAAHYRFSRDTEQRARERAELDRLHAQAQAARAEAGAVDVRPGAEGMQSNERAPSTAARKRKAELEERRNKIKQKKRAVNAEGDESNSTDLMASLNAKPGRQDLEQATDAFLASLEASIKRE